MEFDRGATGEPKRRCWRAIGVSLRDLRSGAKGPRRYTGAIISQRAVHLFTVVAGGDGADDLPVSRWPISQAALCHVRRAACALRRYASAVGRGRHVAKSVHFYYGIDPMYIVAPKCFMAVIMTTKKSFPRPPIVNARWSSGAMQPKKAAAPGAPPPAFASASDKRHLQRSVDLPDPSRRLFSDAVMAAAGQRVPPRSTLPGPSALQLKQDLTAANTRRLQKPPGPLSNNAPSLRIPPADLRGSIQSKGLPTAGIATCPTLLLPKSAPGKLNSFRSVVVQRAVAAPAQAVPPYLQAAEDWASGAHLGDLRDYRFEDAQSWLEENIAKLKGSEGTQGEESIFDAFIARNYAIVELSGGLGTFVGRGISAGASPGVHGERAAFRDAAQQIQYDWTNASATDLWNNTGMRVSRILTDRALCTGSADACDAWAATICGGNNVTTPVYYAVPYTPTGKAQLMSAVRGEIVKYLTGEAQEFYAYVMSGTSKYSWMSSYLSKNY